MEVHVQVHRPTEALNDGDTAAAWIRETLAARPGPQVPLDRPVQNAGDTPAQVVVPGRHVGEHVVDEVRARSAMRRPPQLGQKPRPL